MNATVHGIAVIVALTAATLITRFLPFVLFPAGKETPRYMSYLGKTLPYATIGFLVVYCLKNVRIAAAPFALPEVLAVCSVLILQRWKGNSLLSIGIGTGFYMLLVQFVFI